MFVIFFSISFHFISCLDLFLNKKNFKNVLICRIDGCLAWDVLFVTFGFRIGKKIKKQKQATPIKIMLKILKINLKLNKKN